MRQPTVGMIAIALAINIWSVQDSMAYEWICNEESSVRTGNQYLACGVAIAPTESLARRKALVNAKQEFQEICAESKDCRSKRKNAEPLRTTCKKLSENQFKCYRGIRYTLLAEQDEGENLKELSRLRDERLKILEEEVKIRRGLKEKDEKIARLEKMIKEDNYQKSEDEVAFQHNKATEKRYQEYLDRQERFKNGWWTFGLTYGATAIIGLAIADGGPYYFLIPVLGPIIQITENQTDSTTTTVLSGIGAALQLIGIGIVSFNLPGRNPREVALTPAIGKNRVALNAHLRF